MTAAHARTLCCRDCPAPATHAAHHDRLLLVDVDSDELLALLEMAVTWHELDYSDCDVVGPAGWQMFAESHSWSDPDKAQRAFSLALDIVGRTIVEPVQRTEPAAVIRLVRS
ncbi:hypothetical protein [Pseudonocardia sp. GCM10023141]|uniref:hypothetical protein n=1 Tax=Pseudonocardia sp. GCM10023141 TaxID=3252653 RepID=UPI00361F5969